MYTHKAVATIGKYNKKEDDGSTVEKKRYLDVGMLYQSDKGFQLRLDVSPIVPEWSGWIALWPLKKEESDDGWQQDGGKGKMTHDLCYALGEYEQEGEKKTNWVRCGSVLTYPDGRMSIKLDGVPTVMSKNNDNWLMFLERRQG